MYLLLGFGISNQSVAKYLDSHNIEYRIFDGFKNDINENILDNVNIVVRSPGISLSHPLLMLACSKNIEIISEIEFAYRCNNKGKIIALTGSNGKTSTLYYLYQILKQNYDDVILVGNNGVPYSSYIDKINDNTIVLLELSNFQLENTYTLSPYIAAIINLSENHLDKVANYDEYKKSKLNILKNADNILLNYDDKELRKIIKNNITFLSLNKNIGYRYIRNSVVYNEEVIVKGINNKRLIGNHNKLNLLFAISIANLLNCKINKEIINDIKGVKYRLEYLRTIDGVDIYNDGKSSTPYSCEVAIKAFNNKIIHVIMGGRDKNMDFSFLAKYKNAIFYVYGEIKNKLVKELNAKQFDTFKEAFNHIAAKKGEIILFSPGCTSFDQFKNYEERAKAFEDFILSK